MAMIAVELVVEKLASLISQEAELLGGVSSKIEELRDDLDSMKSFLRDAETRSDDENNNNGLTTWVQQVREVAYDTEDVLEDFLIKFSSSQTHGFIPSVRNIFQYTLQINARHDLAVQIGSIKQRVKSISKRRSAFSFNNITNATTAIPTRHDPRIASLYIDESDVVGIEEPKSVLIKWLVEGDDDKLVAISVVGMGGSGKTTLVKKAFDTQPVKKRFDCQAWITVSKSFTVLELLRAMLKGFFEATKEPLPEDMDRMLELQLVDAIKNHLRNKRYLITLDDVWSIDSWEAVKYALPDCNTKSRVIFTTRSDKIAASIETTCHVYHLEPLPKKEAWLLFCMKAFRGKQRGVCPEILEELSYKILKKCGGLPLAIVLVGGLLSKKNENVLEWKRIHEYLAAEMKSNNNLESLGRILLLSYDDLPHYIKCCYLYLSVFPEDYLIKRTKLVRLWVAERFVEEKPGLTMEEVAEEYINELVSRSMIQVVEMDYFRRVTTFRIHDLVREIVQMKSKDQSLVSIASGKIVKTNDKVRRLSIHDNCEDYSSQKMFPHLRSLLVFTLKGSSQYLPGSFFQSFRLLRVLELELTPLSKFPKEIVKLIHLRYLSLRGTMITELPESIRKLQNLEILDLKRTHVSSLPSGILQLKNLRQLRNYRYRNGASRFFPDTYGMRVPSGIGKLTCLEKLSSVEANSTTIVNELGNLTNLRRLSILELRGEDGIAMCLSLQNMKRLSGLYIGPISNDEGVDMNSITSPPEFLQRVYLKFKLPNLPNWITSLQYLVKLVLQHSSLNIDPLNALQGLPSLAVLELRQAYNGEELRCDAKGYQKLKMLSLFELQCLKSIRLERGAMPELTRIEITACVELEMVPIGIEHLNYLLEMLVWEMPGAFFNRMKRPHGEDYWKVKHIPSITII